MKKYRTVSLFSGAMGLDLGLEATGRFELVACVERQKVFCDTIRTNRDAGRLSPGLKIFEADMSKLDPLQILEECGLRPGDVDLLVGGPPCQPFSTAGKRGTAQDIRGILLWDFLRFIDVIRPKVFVIENVRGLLSAALRHRPIAKRPERGGSSLKPEEKPGSMVRLFAQDLQRLHGGPYHMDCFEVNAVNYGAPQLRERAVFIGNRYNAAVDFPDPTHGPNAGSGAERWQTLGDALGQLSKVPGDVVMDFSPRKKRFLSLVPPGGNWRSLPVDLQRESMGKAWLAKGGRSGWWRRLSNDLPCPTLVTMPNHASTSLCHPTEVRALSVREYAAIQGFPPEWNVCGKPSQQYEQIGNAVPIALGKIIGRIVANELDRLRKRGWRRYAPDLGAYRIVYVQSHVRTRQWFKDGVTFLWPDSQKAKPKYAAPKTLRKETRMAA